jgi:predicted enzyme related to lactoylglutathione lyase
MKFGYTIIYVEDVRKILSFYTAAFGLDVRFIHESGDYGELASGETGLAFASHELGETNIPSGYLKADPRNKPLGYEIALVTEDVEAAYRKALEAGA